MRRSVSILMVVLSLVTAAPRGKSGADIMEALRKSLEAVKKPAVKAEAPKRQGSKRTGSR